MLGKPQTQLPKFNVSTYDESDRESLRQQFYRDYPLLHQVYQFALERYREPNIMPETLRLEIENAEQSADEADGSNEKSSRGVA